MGPGALDVVQADVAPGRTADPLVQRRVVLLDDGHVVSAAVVQIGGVTVLGVQGVRGDHGSGQADAVQERGKGGDLVALAGDLALGEDGAGVVHRRQQFGRCPVPGAGAADGLAVHGDRPPLTPTPGLSCGAWPHWGVTRRLSVLDTGLQIAGESVVEGIAVDAFEDPADGRRMRHEEQAGQRIGQKHEGSQGVRGRVVDPLADRCQGSGVGQDRARRRCEERGQRVDPAAWVTRIGHVPQEEQQVSCVVERVHGRSMGPPFECGGYKRR